MSNQRRSLEDLGFEELMEVFMFIKQRLLSLKQQQTPITTNAMDKDQQMDNESFTEQTTTRAKKSELQMVEEKEQDSEPVTNKYKKAKMESDEKQKSKREDISDEYQAPKRTCKRAKTDNPFSVATQNSFELLSNIDESEMVDEQDTQDEGPSPTTYKPSKKWTYTQRMPEKPESVKGITPIIIR